MYRSTSAQSLRSEAFRGDEVDGRVRAVQGTVLSVPTAHRTWYAHLQYYFGWSLLPLSRRIAAMLPEYAVIVKVRYKRCFIRTVL